MWVSRSRKAPNVPCAEVTYESRSGIPRNASKLLSALTVTVIFLVISNGSLICLFFFSSGNFPSTLRVNSQLTRRSSCLFLRWFLYYDIKTYTPVECVRFTPRLLFWRRYIDDSWVGRPNEWIRPYFTFRWSEDRLTVVRHDTITSLLLWYCCCYSVLCGWKSVSFSNCVEDLDRFLRSKLGRSVCTLGRSATLERTVMFTSVSLIVKEWIREKASWLIATGYQKIMVYRYGTYSKWAREIAFSFAQMTSSLFRRLW